MTRSVELPGPVEMPEPVAHATLGWTFHAVCRGDLCDRAVACSWLFAWMQGARARAGVVGSAYLIGRLIGRALDSRA